MNLKELFEKRAAAGAEIKRLADVLGKEKRSFTADEEKKWSDINADYDRLSKEIEICQRSAAVSKEMEAKFNEGQKENKSNEKSVEERSAIALQGWALGAKATKEHIEAARSVGLEIGSSALEVRLGNSPKNMAEARALSAVQGSAGGFTVPEGFVRSLEVALLNYGAVRANATILRTADGADLPYPTSNDTSNSGEQVGENTAVSEQDVTFGAINLKAYNFSSKMVKVPNVLLQDSAFDLASVLGNMLGERLGRITNTKFTTGSGAATPNGIVSAAYLGKTTSSATAITADEIFDLIHSVDKAYRAQNCGFMLNDAIVLALRKLKDGDGKYIWQQGLTLAEPDRILGFPYFVNNDMDSTIASGKKSILFGQLSKYFVREVGSMRLMRLNERYAEYDQAAFLAFMRFDGNLIDAGTHPVKYMTH